MSFFPAWLNHPSYFRDEDIEDHAALSHVMLRKWSLNRIGIFKPRPLFSLLDGDAGGNVLTGMLGISQWEAILRIRFYQKKSWFERIKFWLMSPFETWKSFQCVRLWPYYSVFKTTHLYFTEGSDASDAFLSEHEDILHSKNKPKSLSSFLLLIWGQKMKTNLPEFSLDNLMKRLFNTTDLSRELDVLFESFVSLARDALAEIQEKAREQDEPIQITDVLDAIKKLPGEWEGTLSNAQYFQLSDNRLNRFQQKLDLQFQKTASALERILLDRQTSELSGALVALAEIQTPEGLLNFLRDFQVALASHSVQESEEVEILRTTLGKQVIEKIMLHCLSPRDLSIFFSKQLEQASTDQPLELAADAICQELRETIHNINQSIDWIPAKAWEESLYADIFSDLYDFISTHIETCPKTWIEQNQIPWMKQCIREKQAELSTILTLDGFIEAVDSLAFNLIEPANMLAEEKEAKEHQLSLKSLASSKNNLGKEVFRRFKDYFLSSRKLTQLFRALLRENQQDDLWDMEESLYVTEHMLKAQLEQARDSLNAFFSTYGLFHENSNQFLIAIQSETNALAEEAIQQMPVYRKRLKEEYYIDYYSEKRDEKCNQAWRGYFAWRRGRGYLPETETPRHIVNISDKFRTSVKKLDLRLKKLERKAKDNPALEVLYQDSCSRRNTFVETHSERMNLYLSRLDSEFFLKKGGTRLENKQKRQRKQQLRDWRGLSAPEKCPELQTVLFEDVLNADKYIHNVLQSYYALCHEEWFLEDPEITSRLSQLRNPFSSRDEIYAYDALPQWVSFSDNREVFIKAYMESQINWAVRKSKIDSAFSTHTFLLPVDGEASESERALALEGRHFLLIRATDQYVIGFRNYQGEYEECLLTGREAKEILLGIERSDLFSPDYEPLSGDSFALNRMIAAYRSSLLLQRINPIEQVLREAFNESDEKDVQLFVDACAFLPGLVNRWVLDLHQYAWLSRNALEDERPEDKKQAYRRLMLKYHPDHSRTTNPYIRMIYNEISSLLTAFHDESESRKPDVIRDMEALIENNRTDHCVALQRSLLEDMDEYIEHASEALLRIEKKDAVIKAMNDEISAKRAETSAKRAETSAKWAETSAKWDENAIRLDELSVEVDEIRSSHKSELDALQEQINFLNLKLKAMDCPLPIDNVTNNEPSFLQKEPDPMKSVTSFVLKAMDCSLPIGNVTDNEHSFFQKEPDPVKTVTSFINEVLEEEEEGLRLQND